MTSYYEVKYKGLIYAQVSVDIEVHLEIVRILFRIRI